VVGAVIGGWLARSGPGPSRSGSGEAASFILLEPAPGSVFFGTGLVSMFGLASGPPGRLEVDVHVDGVEVGSIEVEVDGDGPVSAVVPILPPVDGGPAVLGVRRASADVALASVDIVLEPAHHLIVWAPQSRERLEGPSLDVIGFARPPARTVLLELIAPDHSRLAIETVDLETSSSSSEVAAPWRRFEASLPFPADAEQACLWLTPTALGPSGHALFALDMPLSLAGAPGPRCPPSRGMRQ
ncbi:MAG TPA: hypothetical protein VF971_00485, partial [Candidatus Limnocylindrales bacterium]